MLQQKQVLMQTSIIGFLRPFGAYLRELVLGSYAGLPTDPRAT